MPNRYLYDLTHEVFSCGKVGRLMTLSKIPIVAGDSVSVNMQGNVQMAPLQKQLVTNARFDLFAFFVPHRHVYGTDWIDFIKEGVDEAVNFSVASALILSLIHI